eukprot:363123-Chlamydomonas_euryale.AAC.4
MAPSPMEIGWHGASSRNSCMYTPAYGQQAMSNIQSNYMMSAPGSREVLITHMSHGACRAAQHFREHTERHEPHLSPRMFFSSTPDDAH